MILSKWRYKVLHILLIQSKKWIHAILFIKLDCLCRWSNEQNGACEEIDGLRGMELAMRAWADWVAFNVDPLKKQVFFVTMSPTHQS